MLRYAGVEGIERMMTRRSAHARRLQHHSFSPNEVVHVKSWQDLKEAVAAGAQHIELRDHMDLTDEVPLGNPDGNPEEQTMLAGISSVRTIWVGLLTTRTCMCDTYAPVDTVALSAPPATR